MSTGKGIAIGVIWITVAISSFAIGEVVVYVAIGAVLATMYIADS